MARKFDLKSYLIAWLRRGSYRVPFRKEVKDLARVSRGRYRCAVCSKLYSNGEYAIDHILPVIDPNVGFVDWNTFVSRLFVGADGLQLLCHDCHDKKTKKENKKRRAR